MLRFAGGESAGHVLELGRKRLAEDFGYCVESVSHSDEVACANKNIVADDDQDPEGGGSMIVLLCI